jgi:hypothetical protein
MVDRRNASVPGATPAQPPGRNGNAGSFGNVDRFAPPQPTIPPVASAPHPDLPGWFWGVLGCLSILGVGFTVMFLMIRSPSGTARPPVVAAPAPAGGASSSPGRPSGIQVEQLAPPPAPAPAPVRKAAPRPIKVARTASPAPRAGKPEPVDEPSAEETDADDEPAPKAKPSPAHAPATAATEAEPEESAEER